MSWFKIFNPGFIFHSERNPLVCPYLFIHRSPGPDRFHFNCSLRRQGRSHSPAQITPAERRMLFCFFYYDYLVKLIQFDPRP